MPVLAATLAFSSRAYNDAINLLHETRGLILAGQDTPADEPASRLRVNAEYSRVASRLAHVVAWLMAQKAVQTGEATWTTALGTQPPLASVSTCAEDLASDDTELPQGLRDLLGRSHELYTRVARLDEQARTKLA